MLKEFKNELKWKFNQLNRHKSNVVMRPYPLWKNNKTSDFSQNKFEVVEHIKILPFTLKRKLYKNSRSFTNKFWRQNKRNESSWCWKHSGIRDSVYCNKDKIPAQFPRLLWLLSVRYKILSSNPLYITCMIKFLFCSTSHFHNEYRVGIVWLN